MKHNNFFLERFKNDNDIDNLRTFVLTQSAEVDLDEKYTMKIDSFLDQNFTENFDHELSRVIAYNYWLHLVIFYKNMNREEVWCEKTIWEYLICAIRIMEFSIYILFQNNKELMDLFFNIDYMKGQFFHHFKELKINDTQFLIQKIKNKKNRVHITMLDEFYYRSKININSKNIDSMDSWFTYYFKLNHEYVNYVFNMFESENSSKNSGSKGSMAERIPFQEVDEINKLSFINGGDDFETIENIKDKLSRAKKIPFFDLQNSSIKITEKPLLNFEVSSPFKVYQINKAIGHSISKQNMKLKSTYRVPHFEQLKAFIIFLNTHTQIAHESKLIQLSLYLGINLKKIIFFLLNKDTDIRFDKKNKLTIKIVEKCFANSKNSYNKIGRKVKNDTVELILPNLLSNFCKQIQDDLNEEFGSNLSDEEVNNLIDEKINLVNEILNNVKKEFPKRFVITIKTLPILSTQYYSYFNKTSDISLLFIGNLNKNDQAKVCYVSQKKQLFGLQNWMSSFINMLNTNNSANMNLSIKNNNDNWVGSPFFVHPYAFKNFVMSLQNYETNDELQKVNLLMIFLRYSLSILLATRNLTESCNLSNFSKRNKLLFLQEKNKNLVSSKRVIGLTIRAEKYINIFYELKRKYKLDSDSPVLLINNEKLIEQDMSTTNIKSFIKKINTNNKLDDVENFVSNAPLNFGRHLFSTYAVTSNIIESKNIDAFLNHFLLGSVDQGIYSNFDNKKYFQQSREFIENLEELYFPNYLKLGEHNDKHI